MVISVSTALIMSKSLSLRACVASFCVSRSSSSLHSSSVASADVLSYSRCIMQP